MGEMKVDIDGLRRNIARSTNELVPIIEGIIESENCSVILKNSLINAYDGLSSEVWTLVNMSGDLDEPLERLNIDILSLKNLEEK